MSDVTISKQINKDDLALVVFYSLLGGSTSLLPIPFLDDWIYSIVRRQMVQAILIRRDFRLPWDQVRLLSDKPSPFSDQGCLKTGGTILFWWPIRFLVYIAAKIFKKVLYLLAIKEATDRASHLFHSGYLLDYGLKRARKGVYPTEAAISALRNSLWEMEQEIDSSPIRNIFRAVIRVNRQLLSQAARLFRSITRFFFRPGGQAPNSEKTQKVIDEQGKVLGGVVEETTRIIMGDKGYLLSIESMFRKIARKNGLIFE